jgi:hypothetical protein
MSSFTRNIAPFVASEIQAARVARQELNHSLEFQHLEQAHVLGQLSTLHHVRVHWLMFLWGIHYRNIYEVQGQILRIVGAATKTAIGLVPSGNTGGSNVSPFKRLPVPLELQAKISAALDLQ